VAANVSNRGLLTLFTTVAAEASNANHPARAPASLCPHDETGSATLEVLSQLGLVGSPAGWKESTTVKYVVSTEIALPREQVVQLLADPVHLPKWLRGLVLHEPLTGVHGQVGTTSRVVLRMGQQEIEATETIIRREPSDLRGVPGGTAVHFDREIVTKDMWNAARERLTEVTPGTTLWESENEYRFSGLPMRIVSQVMRGAFRKQSRQHMMDFKAFAEQGTDVREATEGSG
jgi:hypothetical protein